MRCYFHGSVDQADPLVKTEGTVSFAVPDLGIIFRSRWTGNLYDIQFAALISLLKFIENNDKIFKGTDIEIHSDAAVIIYQLTKNPVVPKSMIQYYQAVQQYRAKFPFKLSWVPLKDNPACHGLSDLPPLKPTVEIRYDIKDSAKKTVRRGGVPPS